MNNNFYPPWWDTTLTIFNKYEDSQTHVVTWYKHTIDNCFWKYTGNKLTIDQVTLDTNRIVCRIPKSAKFKEKFEWVQVPNDKMSKFFTLGVGDIIVKGKVDDEINEYQANKRSSDLLGKYKALQGCMEVEAVAINVGNGRCSEHYYVQGI